MTSLSICFITAIYGNYENTCKKYVSQTVDSDFICFTDNANIEPNGWEIDTHAYHLENNLLDNGSYTNSISNNKHTFNIAKYYKESFMNIPRLQKYDVVVWIDGTIEIIYDKTAEYVLHNIYDHKIIGWKHEYNTKLSEEVIASIGSGRYTTTSYNGQEQPYQDVEKQYSEYIANGYDEEYFSGIWITCFVAFLVKDDSIQKLLDLWYLHNLQYTTQDQISFPFVCQKMGITPFTLPNLEIYGNNPHYNTMFYIKHGHGN